MPYDQVLQGINYETESNFLRLLSARCWNKVYFVESKLVDWQQDKRITVDGAVRDANKSLPSEIYSFPPP